MTGRISARELQRLIADDSTSDEVLAQYLTVTQAAGQPLSPAITVDPDKIDGPVTRGLFEPIIHVLNAREHRRRLAAYNQRIKDGWKGPRLLAEGDSWFMYPVLLKDVISCLGDDYAIYSLAAAGDTLDNMARGIEEIERLIDEHKFDAFLISAGGNDLAGEPLKRYLQKLAAPVRNPIEYLGAGLDQFLASVLTTYDGLFKRLTVRFPDLRILCHGYDWALPRNKGRWLGPPMAERGVPDEMQAAVIRTIIDRFYGTLGELAARYPSRVQVVDCRGSIGNESEWWDELHPRNPGYARVANCFRARLRSMMIGQLRSDVDHAGIELTWRPRDEVTGARVRRKSLPVGSIVTIGRSSEREIVLEDDRVSRNHARIEVRSEDVVVEDTGSANGTTISGEGVKAAAWLSGQELAIGFHVFSYERTVPAESAIAASHATTLAAQAPAGTLLARLADAAAGNGITADAAQGAQENSRPARFRLDIEIVHGNLVDIAAPAYVVGIFEHVSPLASRGPASAIDLATNGDMSDLVQSGLFGCRLGEISLLPTPQQDLLTEIIAFAGLGSLTTFSQRALEAVGENLAKVLLAARISGCATVPLGTNTGCSIPEFVNSFMRGLLKGITWSAKSEEFRKLIICEMNTDRHRELLHEIEALRASPSIAAAGFELTVTSLVVPPGRPSRILPVAPTISTRHVFVTSVSDNAFQFFTLGLGAGVPCYVQQVDLQRRSALALKAAGLATSFDAQLGQELAELFIPQEIRTALGTSICDEGSHLVVVHDSGSSNIPWEALYFGDRCAALESGVSRKCRINPIRLTGAPLSTSTVLKMLVVYPGYSSGGLKALPGAEEEGHQLSELFKQNNGEVTILSGSAATKAAMIKALDEGNYSLLHYAGHAMFDDHHTERCGLLLDNGETVTSSDFVRLAAVPKLVFFNACESGRMRGGGSAGHSLDDATLGTNASLAESLFSIGVGNFVGTYWPVEDRSAQVFAQTLYGRLLRGELMGLALRGARLAVKEKCKEGQRHWANYLHFGEPTDRLRDAAEKATSV
jgi:pSer/pThr/pTyr-binding forkhead associated (FHA) protein/lysophospholipase L1-like esterase